MRTPFSAVLVAALCGSLAAREQRHAEAFDRFWNALRDHYAYLDESGVDWNEVNEIYRPMFVDAANDSACVALFESVFDELRDSHVQLNRNVADSYRLLPSGSDLVARLDGDAAIVTHVRPDSAAARAGLVVGMRIVSIQGQRIPLAIERRLGACKNAIDEVDRAWALRSALAGRRDRPRVLEVERDGERRTISIEGFTLPPSHGPLEWRSLEGGIGYVRLHDSLGDSAMVPAFDDALTALRDTRAMILDLRDTPSGGNTTNARSLLGRFVAVEMPYQKHELASELRLYGVHRSWLELVSPRGPFVYPAPVVVLVDPWTGSMGEGVAIAFDGMKRGTVIGCEMARLRGATDSLDLGLDGLTVWFPTERLFHVDGTPRHRFVPPVYVDALAPEHREETDPILARALEFLRSSANR